MPLTRIFTGASTAVDALFGDRLFTPADEGGLFVEGDTSGLNFIRMATRLTNGVDDPFFIGRGGEHGGSLVWHPDESAVLSGVFRPNGIDLQGHSIDAVSLLVDTLRIENTLLPNGRYF